MGSDVAFRKEADGNSDIICRLNKGTGVEILKTNVNAQWDQVKYDGKVGYVNRVYVPLDSFLHEYKTEYTGKVVNCKKFVSIRSEPSKSSKEVGTANLGTTLKVLQKDYSNGWDQVTFEGQDAYISSSYLDVNAVVPDTQLSGLSISGGSLYPAFSPKEYEYRITASSSNVSLTAKANSGVNIDINGTGTDSMKISMSPGSVKIVNISLNGKQKYSFVITRNILVWGTWNIKSGNGQLLMQGRLVYDQRPDFMGIQEAVQNTKSSNVVDDLASLKTSTMCYTDFSRTYYYSGDYEFGDGILSRYKLSNIQNFPLDSSGYEPRLLQKAVVNIGGKTVSVYNTHFTYQTADARSKQFAEVLSYMDKDKNKYKILTGDFNANDSEFALFKNNYNVSINSEAKYYNPSGGLINHNAIDNIIVTKNIKVVNTNFIETSLSDHNAVFAYLVLQ